MATKPPEGFYTRMGSPHVRTRALYRDALTRVPDAVVQRVYEISVGKGRRDLANYAAIEAGQRLDKRAVRHFKARGEPISRADMEQLDAEYKVAYNASRKPEGGDANPS